MASLNAQLPLRVQNVLGGAAPDLNVLLTFQSMDNFDPADIVMQVPQLKDLYNRRILLSDLISKLDGNDGLDAELRNIIDNPDVLAQLKKELGSGN